MNEATVTSRIPATTKLEAQKILERVGTNSSRVINSLFDRIVEEDGIAFLSAHAKDGDEAGAQGFKRAIEFIDSIPVSRSGKFDDMTKNEIKMQILKDRGLL